MNQGIYEVNTHSFQAEIDTYNHKFSIKFTNGVKIAYSNYPKYWNITRIMQFILSLEKAI